MNKARLIDTLLLFGSLAFLVMWADQFVYKGVAIKDSYFYLMFALAGFLYYTYRRGMRVQQEKNDAEKTSQETTKKTAIKPTASSASPKKKPKRK